MARDPDALAIQKWSPPDADATTPDASRIANGYDQPFSRQGGPLPPREDFNYYRRGLSGLAVEINEVGLPEWDSGQTYRHDATGGAAVMRNGKPYVSLQGSTNIDPAMSGGEAYWDRLYTKAEIDTLLAAINATIAGLGTGDLTRALADTLYLALANAGTAATADTGTNENDIPVLGPGGVLDDGVLPDATISQQGVVELATNAETETGTDSQRAVTPAGFRAAGDARYTQPSDLGTAAAEDVGTASGDIPVLGTGGELDEDRLPSATTTAKGAVELATNSEAGAGTDTTRAITPSSLRSAGDARYLTQTDADGRYFRQGATLDEDGLMTESAWSDAFDNAFGTSNGIRRVVGSINVQGGAGDYDEAMFILRNSTQWEVYGWNISQEGTASLLTVRHAGTSNRNLDIDIAEVIF